MEYDLYVNTDASLAPSRKIGCIAWVIKKADGKLIERRAHVVYTDQGHVIETTYLELLAIKNVLKRVFRFYLKDKKIVIRTDSLSAKRKIDLVHVNKGQYSSDLLPKLAYKIRSQIIQLKLLQGNIIDLEWVSRSQNNEADKDARSALKKCIIRNLKK